MATTHDPRHRQRTPHRTTSAHARSVVLNTGARARTAPNPPADEIVVVEREAPVKARPIRTPDSDDHLATYFRHLAEHELLTPEDERELSQGIEDTEILTWERVLARPDTITKPQRVHRSIPGRR